MTQINLLPWREEARKIKKIKFALIVATVIGLLLLGMMLVHVSLSQLITIENDRIDFLQTAIKNKQNELVTLNIQKKQYTLIKDELKFIQNMKAVSSNAVDIMNELIKIVPSTIILERLTKDGNKLTLQGNAVSELQVTLLMKNLSNSKIFMHPVLTKISETQNNSDTGRLFELDVEIKE